jgi:hypothetical protein
VLAGIASFAIAAPVGYALAQDGPRNVGDPPVAAEPVPVPPPATSQHPEAETFLVKPSPELVATCDQRLKVAPDDAGCRTVALLAAGDLNPGAYTNAEFDRAVSQATAPSDR